MINCKVDKHILNELNQIDLIQYGQDIDADIIYLEDLLELDIRNEILQGIGRNRRNKQCY